MAKAKKYWMIHYGEGFYDGYFLSSAPTKKAVVKEAKKRFNFDSVKVAEEMCIFMHLELDGPILNALHDCD